MVIKLFFIRKNNLITKQKKDIFVSVRVVYTKNIKYRRKDHGQILLALTS